MIDYAVEKWADFYRDGQLLFPEHYRELARDQERIKLDIDEAKYENAEKQGMLHIVTVRHNGRLVGYYIAAILGHLHYKSAGPMAHTDLYYLLPDYRRGGIGLKMLIFLEQSLKKLGITKIYVSTKVHMDNSELLEALGYRLTDKVFTKLT